MCGARHPRVRAAREQVEVQGPARVSKLGIPWGGRKALSGFVFPELFVVIPTDAWFLFHPSDFCEDWTEAQRIAASLLDSKSYETLVDFDNHLDDIRNDWTNPEINKAVLHLC